MIHTIELNLSNPCPGRLADINHPTTIGCAMGEAMFQAGVPVDVLNAYHDTKHLFAAHKEHQKRFCDHYGLKEADLIDIIMVEQAYDTIAMSNRDMSRVGTGAHLIPGDGQAAAESICEAWIMLTNAGLRLNINFVLTDKPQQLAACPAKVAAPACAGVGACP